jgi:hypothetical protein
MEVIDNKIIEKRKKARELAERQAREADMKQHADKLFQGFKKLSDSHAKRAIWELFQNAVDVSNGSCEVKIELQQESITFSHNGKPFTPKTLISLIKQVSSKSDEDNDEEVGQYGTGFITTHSFGKKITLSGSVEDQGEYISLSNFEIDRIADSSKDLIEKLSDQEEAVFDLVEKGQYINTPNTFTSFTFHTNSQLEKDRAKEALVNFKEIIPYVLTINKSLKKVTVSSYEENYKEYEYIKGETTNNCLLNKTTITLNAEGFDVVFLADENKETIVLLPINNKQTIYKFTDNLPRLFLYYPLIGTEQFGVNFIIHSKTFYPTEPRDGVYLKSTNEQTQQDEESNRKIIELASNMVFTYLKDNCSSLRDTINLANIRFKNDSDDNLLNEFFEELKGNWVEVFKKLELIDSIEPEEKYAPADTLFFHEELLLDESKTNKIYDLVQTYNWDKPFPLREEVKEWSNIVENWDSEDIEFIRIDDVLKRIAESGSLDEFTNVDDLQIFYQYLIDNALTEKFDDFKLIPNINGDFCLKAQLKKGVNIDSKYLPTAKKLIPATISTLIDEQYIFGLEYEEFSRNKLFLAFSEKLQKYYEKGSDLAITDDVIKSCLDLCSIFPKEGITSKRKEIVELLCRQYNFQFKEIIISNVEDDKFDYDATPTTALIRIICKDFIAKSEVNLDHVSKNIFFLSTFLSHIYSQYDYRDILKSVKIFPSQNYKLTDANSLCKEANFLEQELHNEYLKDIYEKIVGEIRGKLLHNDFVNIGTVSQTQELKHLTLEIEDKFKEEDLGAINNHSHSKTILEIVEKITGNEDWEELFPHLNDKKAVIMMSKISDEEVKGDLFKIIGSDKSRISLLGELSQEENLERIIELGKRQLQENSEREADFQFKYQIGTHIENLIRNKIEKEIEGFKVEVKGQQGGQDVIIKIHSEEVYYVEVKSRWDNRNSITMSRLQMEKSAEYSNKYSLCCVEMCDYYPEYGDRYKVEDIKLIEDRVNIINGIGYQIEPLIRNNIQNKQQEGQITLVDDYRAIIPQVIVKRGISLDEFVDYLINKLNLQ